MRKTLVWLSVLVVLGAAGYGAWTMRAELPALLALATGDGPAQQAGPQPGKDFPVPVEAVAVQVGPITREIAAVGSLRSDESVMIRPEIAGRVAEIRFEEGQRVAKGDVLLTLDDSTWRAQLEQARANLALSEANDERARKLFSQGAGTERARDEAAAGLRVDRAAIELAEAQLRKTRVLAPFDGIVGLRKVSVGAYVTAGQDIVNLEKIDPVKADFRVPEVYLSAVRVGQTLEITADAFPGTGFAGVVYAIDPQIDVNGRAVVVRARVPNPSLTLRPGLFVRVALILDEVQNAIMVPEEAIVPRGGESMVYRVVGDGFEAVPVRLGIRRGGMVEVVEGLTPQDTVITAGHMKLRPGAKVVITQAGGSPAGAKHGA